MRILLIFIFPVLLLITGIIDMNKTYEDGKNVLPYYSKRSTRCRRSFIWSQKMMAENSIFFAMIILPICAIAAIIALAFRITNIMLVTMLAIEIIGIIASISKIEMHLKKEHKRWDIK